MRPETRPVNDTKLRRGTLGEITDLMAAPRVSASVRAQDDRDKPVSKNQKPGRIHAVQKHHPRS